MKPLALMLLLIAMLTTVTGCYWLTPTLAVRKVPLVPEPNSMFERNLWEDAKPLTVKAQRGSGATRQERTVQLRAVYDGRAISIFASWTDPTESHLRYAWVWSPEHSEYQLAEYKVDMFAVLWPLSDSASLNLFEETHADYDCWQWTGGWSNFSGFGDDNLLLLRPHDATAETSQALTIYHRPGTRQLQSMDWRFDPGKPSLRIKPRPSRYIEKEVSAIMQQTPRGSAADVMAYGGHHEFNAVAPNRWFVNAGQLLPNQLPDGSKIEERGLYMLELFRLLNTKDVEHDYQFNTKTSHRFVIAIHDHERGPNFFLTPPLRLVFK